MITKWTNTPWLLLSLYLISGALYLGLVQQKIIPSPKNFELAVVFFNVLTYSISTTILYLPIKSKDEQAFVLKFILSLTVQMLAFLAFVTIGVVLLKSKALVIHTLILFGVMLLLQTVFISLWRNERNVNIKNP
jgi:hypothetical protein